VWAFSDVNTVPLSTATDPNRVWFQLLNSTGSFINYGADGLQRLDYVVSAAERLGVGLVLPFVNNWNDYGGMNAYAVAFSNVTAGSSAPANWWYTDSRAQQTYRSYIRTIVTRYAASPAVFAWELANEARCSGCGSPDIVAKWVAETAAYIKSLDPAHMVTTGEEGFFAAADGLGNSTGVYSGSAGTSFTRNIAIPDIDYGTFHLYPSWWGYDYSWGIQWINEHDAIGKKVGKPVVLEEYGTPFRNNNHTATIAPWLDAILKSGLATDQLWQFGPNGTSVDPASLGDEFTVNMADSESVQLCDKHAEDMLAKKVVPM
jgi:mannan endo-1,4-beta-mannosidase